MKDSEERIGRRALPSRRSRAVRRPRIRLHSSWPVRRGASTGSAKGGARSEEIGTGGRDRAGLRRMRGRRLSPAGVQPSYGVQGNGGQKGRDTLRRWVMLWAASRPGGGRIEEGVRRSRQADLQQGGQFRRSPRREDGLLRGRMRPSAETGRGDGENPRTGPAGTRPARGLSRARLVSRTVAPGRLPFGIGRVCYERQAEEASWGV